MGKLRNFFWIAAGSFIGVFLLPTFIYAGIARNETWEGTFSSDSSCPTSGTWTANLTIDADGNTTGTYTGTGFGENFSVSGIIKDDGNYNYTLGSPSKGFLDIGKVVGLDTNSKATSFQNCPMGGGGIFTVSSIGKIVKSEPILLPAASSTPSAVVEPKPEIKPPEPKLVDLPLPEPPKPKPKPLPPAIPTPAPIISPEITEIPTAPVAANSATTTQVLPAQTNIIQKFEDLKNNPKVVSGVKRIVAPAAIVAGAAGAGAAASVAVNSSASFAINFSKLLQGLGSSRFYLLSALRLKKRKPWGRVINALNKKPVNGATVRIYEATLSKLKDAQLTDEQGRFNAFVAVGKYYVEARR